MEGAPIPELRQAATVIVARQARVGVEVLVLRRSVASRFLPGYLVFPGGAVDPRDADRAARWFGAGEEAARACAVRELIEEAGLALTSRGLRELHDDVDRALDASPPRTADLPEVARWIAPEGIPVRFDARYFAVAAADGLTPAPDGIEADRAWWARPGMVLDDFEAGRCSLYWPTLKTIEALARCDSVADVLRLRVPQVDI